MRVLNYYLDGPLVTHPPIESAQGWDHDSGRSNALPCVILCCRQPEAGNSMIYVDSGGSRIVLPSACQWSILISIGGVLGSMAQGVCKKCA
jgi:hypothetical protein